MTDNISGIVAPKLKDSVMGIPIGNGTDNDSSRTNTSNEANREIAKLLLTLHASGTSAPPSSEIAAFSNDNQKAEDLSVRVTNNGNNKTYQQSMQTEMALDLTSSSSNNKAISLTSSDSLYSAPLPASISKIVKSATSVGGNNIVDLTSGGSMASITKTGNVKHGSSAKLLSGNTNLATVTVKPSSKLQQAPQPLQINPAPTSNTSTNVAQAAAAAATASYPFYPQLASMANQLSPSTLSNLDKALSSNANYLLQNLLLGKIGQMQQIASGSTASNAPTSPALATSAANSTTITLPASSLPTQPIPAQALALPTIPVSIKPPASVLKGAQTNSFGLTSPNNLLNTQISSMKLSSNALQPTITAATSTNMASNNIITQISSSTSPIGSNSNPLQLIEGNTATNIPLLCGQIVAQLNGLLFLVHGLNNTTIELNLQQQLIAIYTRLQEVVAMVEQAKNQQSDNVGSNAKKNDAILSPNKQGNPKYNGGNSNITTINTTSNINNEMIQKELEKIKDSKIREEEKIAKHIQEYQRQLLQQQNISSCLKTGTTITPIPATSIPSSSAVTLSSAAANLSSLTAGDSSIAAAAAQAMAAAVSNSLASLLKPQGALSETATDIIASQMQQEADSNSLLLSQQERDRNRRRGRPPKTSGADLAQIYSSPEPKRSRSSSINTSDGVTVTLAPAVTLPQGISQNALSLNVPSGIVADLSMNRHNTNGKDTSPQITLNGLGANANIMHGTSNGINVSPTSNGAGSVMITSNGTITPGTGGGGKGGKGIRNRVFCGECPGCLQNDDCGKCRYCKDKTKFGGQNRLRQKCLHRRCQMDTHRKRNSTNNNNNGNGGPNAGSLPTSVSAIVAAATGGGASANNAVSSSPNPTGTNSLYSGVDLARLAAASQQHQLNLNAAAVAAAAQVTLEHQQNLDKGASAMLNNEVSITTAISPSNNDTNDVSNTLAAHKESSIVIGTTLNVPKIKTSATILTDDNTGRDPEDLTLSMVRRSTRRSQRSSAVVADLKIAELQGQPRAPVRSSSTGSTNGTAAANSVSSASDDEATEDGHRNGPGSSGGSVSSMNSGSKSKSRIDKWKAKHEAMLKMAENNKNKDHEEEEDNIEGEGKEIGKVEDEDEDDDMLVNKGSMPLEDDAEQNSVKSGTTSSNNKKRMIEVEDSSKVPSSKKARLRTTRSGSSLSNKDDEISDDENDELDESEVEIPNIEPNGVCIDLGDGNDEEPSDGKKSSTTSANSKLNMVTSTRSTRHNSMQQQQALSV